MPQTTFEKNQWTISRGPSSAMTSLLALETAIQKSAGDLKASREAGSRALASLYIELKQSSQQFKENDFVVRFKLAETQFYLLSKDPAAPEKAYQYFQLAQSTHDPAARTRAMETAQVLMDEALSRMATFGCWSENRLFGWDTNRGFLEFASEKLKDIQNQRSNGAVNRSLGELESFLVRAVFERAYNSGLDDRQESSALALHTLRKYGQPKSRETQAYISILEALSGSKLPTGTKSLRALEEAFQYIQLRGPNAEKIALDFLKVVHSLSYNFEDPKVRPDLLSYYRTLLPPHISDEVRLAFTKVEYSLRFPLLNQANGEAATFRNKLAEQFSNAPGKNIEVIHELGHLNAKLCKQQSALQIPATIDGTIKAIEIAALLGAAVSLPQYVAARRVITPGPASNAAWSAHSAQEFFRQPGTRHGALAMAERPSEDLPRGLPGSESTPVEIPAFPAMAFKVLVTDQLNRAVAGTGNSLSPKQLEAARTFATELGLQIAEGSVSRGNIRKIVESTFRNGHVFGIPPAEFVTTITYVRDFLAQGAPKAGQHSNLFQQVFAALSNPTDISPVLYAPKVQTSSAVRVMPQPAPTGRRDSAPTDRSTPAPRKDETNANTRTTDRTPTPASVTQELRQAFQSALASARQRGGYFLKDNNGILAVVLRANAKVLFVTQIGSFEVSDDLRVFIPIGGTLKSLRLKDTSFTRVGPDVDYRANKPQVITAEGVKSLPDVTKNESR